MARNLKHLCFDMDVPEQREAYQKLTGCCDGRLNMTKISLSILSLYNSPPEPQAVTRNDLAELEKRLMDRLNNLAVVADPKQPEETEEEFNPDELPDFLFEGL